MNERTNIVTMKGSPVTLVGNEVRIGDPAPDFLVIDNDLSPVSFSSYENRVCLISSVPSLDTPICDLQTKVFNEKATQLDADIAILTISMDLPFAQKRWCVAAGADNVQTLSDHRDASFGKAFGLLIKELRLLARAVFLVDRAGIVQYAQLVEEIANEPDYEALWSGLSKMI
jgi:thiol peroxidase